MYTVNQLGQPVVKMDFSNSMEFIRETTLTASGTVTWTNIPQDYAHLVIIGWARSTYGSYWGGLGVQFNADTGNNYIQTFIQAQGHDVAALGKVYTASANLGIGIIPGSTSTANYFGGVYAVIPYYSRSGYKSAISISGPAWGTSTSDTYVRPAQNGMWSNSSPVTQITITGSGAGNPDAGSSFSLYGIRNIENRALGDLAGERARFRATWDGVTTQNITNNTPTIIQFPTVVEDTHGGWSSYQYTIPRTGIYAVDFRILLTAFTTATTNWVETDLVLNSSTETRGDREWGNGASQNIGSEFSEIRKFTAGDVLGFYVHQLSGATRTIYASNQWNTVSVMEIGV